MVVGVPVHRDAQLRIRVRLELLLELVRLAVYPVDCVVLHGCRVLDEPVLVCDLVVVLARLHLLKVDVH